MGMKVRIPAVEWQQTDLEEGVVSHGGSRYDMTRCKIIRTGLNAAELTRLKESCHELSIYPPGVEVKDIKLTRSD